MICPKCKFDQPDDIYCALCGVNIERYAQEKRKRRYKAFILIGLIGIAGFSVAKYMHSTHHARTPEMATKEGYSNGLQARHSTTPAARNAHQVVPESRLDREGKTENRLGRRSREITHTPDELKDEGIGGNKSIGTPTQDQQEPELGDGQDIETLTAPQWYEKGKALDDDSEAEIRCYERAIETDPEFALPYYRLGAIYYRRANFELADDEFASFLKYASDAEKQAHDIHVYYSLGEAERLSQKIEEKVPAEEGQTEVSEEEKEAVGQETTEEVMTVVKFSPVGGHIMVPVVLNGFLSTTVLVDTGAGITVLSRQLAGELGIEGGPGKLITLKTMATDIQAQLARLDSIQVGSLRKDYFPVAITDLPIGNKGKFHGILGMDFMNNYKINIDNQRQTIELIPEGQ